MTEGCVIDFFKKFSDCLKKLVYNPTLCCKKRILEARGNVLLPCLVYYFKRNNFAESIKRAWNLAARNWTSCRKRNVSREFPLTQSILSKIFSCSKRKFLLRLLFNFFAVRKKFTRSKKKDSCGKRLIFFVYRNLTNVENVVSAKNASFGTINCGKYI